MNIAIVGCGYVADFYMASLKYHPDLKIVGVFDKNTQRLKQFCEYYSLKVLTSLDEILSDPTINIILNLTDPRSHYEINKLCLEAGKHVYSEKPLAMNYEQAAELAALAKQRNLYLSSAPCSVLSEAAQTLLKALQEDTIGKVRMVYANFDAGMSALSKPWLWKSPSGACWPAQDEFEVGCTYEHAGYILTWLAAFFGSAETISAFASLQAPEKGISVHDVAPDFTVGLIKYKNNVVARVTCSLAAPSDRSLTIIGDKGVLYVKDIRDDTSPVYLRNSMGRNLLNALQYRLNHGLNFIEKWLNWMIWSWGNYFYLSKRYPFKKKPEIRYSGKYKPVDFCRGLEELSCAIKEKRTCKLSEDFAAHIVELTEVLQYPERFDRVHLVRSRFDENVFL